MTIFDGLNLIVEVVTPCVELVFQIEEDDSNMFGVKAYMEESSRALVIVKLFLFRRLSIPPSMCVHPLVL